MNGPGVHIMRTENPAVNDGAITACGGVLTQMRVGSECGKGVYCHRGYYLRGYSMKAVYVD